MVPLPHPHGADSDPQIDESPLRDFPHFLVLTKSTFDSHPGHMGNESFPNSALWMI
jgi:hypothetical protein